MKIAVIGGDKRMLFAAKAFCEEGHEVAIAGFDHLVSLCEITIMTPFQAARWADLIVLPVRPIMDGYLSAPFSEEPVDLIALLHETGEKPVFGGCADQLSPFKQGKVYDYAAREEFTLCNAELTAEGALGILLNDYEGSICGTQILVTGYGRIGKMLSGQLDALGAKVTVAARKVSDRALIELGGLNAVDYPEIDYARYRVIINTVPAMVIDRKAVDKMREDVFLIDLASRPGGMDFVRIGERGLSCIHALSLPGKTAPLAAGRIIKDTIRNILSESAV